VKEGKLSAETMNYEGESRETMTAGIQDASEVRPDVETLRLKRSNYFKGS
jgi:hypothetical protein